MNNIKTIILIVAFFICFVNYTNLNTSAKENFEYNVYRPETFEKLQTETPKFESDSNVLFIVDFSNSMNDKMGQKTKMQVALDTLTIILPKIPANVKFGRASCRERVSSPV